MKATHLAFAGLLAGAVGLLISIRSDDHNVVQQVAAATDPLPIEGDIR